MKTTLVIMISLARRACWRLAFGFAFAACMLGHSLTAHAYGNTVCAGERFGSNLNCTANDVSITNIAIAAGSVSTCEGGQNITLSLDLTVNFASPDRYDVGIFVSTDQGKSPQNTVANGGASSCAVAILPTTSPFLNLNGNACGDGNNGISGGTGNGHVIMNNVTLRCAADPSTGKLSVPFVVSWSQSAGNVCNSIADPVPGTTSKCNAPTGANTLIDVNVMPSISITDGLGTVDQGASTSYTVVVTNNSGAALSGISLTSPAIAGLTIGGISCVASGGATCPSLGGGSVGNLESSGGIGLPSIPNGGTLTFTLTGTVSATATGTLTKTATMTVNSRSSSASDSTTIRQVADLAMNMSRSASLVPGNNATYSLSVTNNGTGTEPGSITVTDTLPASLTYVSAAGTGWSCSASGQVVTCTRSGSLATGASTNAITLTVAVSSSASGTVTNTATVAGSGVATDTNSANNTATDSYTILAPYAYYKFDEASWTGAANEVLDSSGNGRNANRMVGSSTTTTDQSTTFGHDCRGMLVTANTGIATTSGMQTTIDINSLGNSGTIGFWYYNNAAWVTAGNNFDRSLADGSGGILGQFWLVLQQTGALRFALSNASGTLQTLDGAVHNFAANSWHHIAITWNFTTNTMKIYVDGSLDATNTNAAITSTANYFNLLMGDSTISLTAPNRGNSANGIIDEVRLYNSDLSAADVTALMSYAHSCAGASLNNIRIEHDGSAISCNLEAVVVKACANAACTTMYTGGVTGNLTAGGNSVPFTISSGQSQTTVNIHVPTDTSLADPQTVRFGTSSLSVSPTDTSSPYCSNNGGTANNTTACDISVSKAGFLFDVPNISSGLSSGTVSIRAVKSSDTTVNCTSLFQSVTRSVNLWGVYQNPATGTVALKVNGSNIETIGSAGTPSYTSSFNLAFDSTGTANLTSVQYDDVGLMQLNARYVGSTSNTPPDGGMIVRGSDTFTVRPFRFDISGIKCTTINAANCGPGAMAMATPGDNPSANNSGGATFIRAGHPFTMTVTAKNAAGNATPNFGKETPAQGVALTPALVSGIGLTNNPALGIGAGFGAFNNGAATGTGFSWQEVGIITIAPSVTSGNYLTSGGDVGTTGSIATGSNTLTVASAAGAGITAGSYVTLIHPSGLSSHFTSAVTSVSGNTVTLAQNAPSTFTNATVYLSSANVGRFYPYAFALTKPATSITNRYDVCPLGTETNCPSTFTYAGEQMMANFTLTAIAYDSSNLPSVTTQNYAGSFAKLNPTTAPGAGSSGPLAAGAVNVGTTRTIFSICAALTDATPCFMPGTATGTFASGVANVALPLTPHRPNTPYAPYTNLRFGIAPQDSDSVIIKSSANITQTGYDMDTVNVVEDTANYNHAFIGNTTGNTVVRWGRLWISNVHGSELLRLQVPVRAQFWNGTSFVTNTNDSKTSFATSSIIQSNWQKPPTPLPSVSFSTTPNINLASGVGNFIIDAPGQGHTGSVNLSFTAISYLPTQFPGKAAFGIYKGADTFIYLRENF